MNLHAELGKSLNSGPNIHRIAAEAIKLCHHEHIVLFETVEQFSEARAFRSGHASADAFFDNASPVDLETSRLDLTDLVCGLLVERAHAR